MKEHLFRNYLFKDISYADLLLCQFGEEQCLPFHSYGPAIRNHYLFHYIISGKGKYCCNVGAESGRMNETILTAGQGFLITPNSVDIYAADGDEPWHYIWLEFDGIKASSLISQAGFDKDVHTFRTKRGVSPEIMYGHMRQIIDNPENGASFMLGHLYLFLDELIRISAFQREMRTQSLKEYYVQEATYFMRDNYQRNISMDDVAAACNLNRNYFSQIFKQMMFITPQQFLIKYRIDKACTMLVQSDMTINEIAEKVGYTNQLQFSRAFSNVMGIPPREYRNNNPKAAKAEMTQYADGCGGTMK